MLPAFYTDDGSGLPVLFVHAFPLNSSMWRAQRRDLNSFFRILTFDLPGFGRGGAFPERFTLDDAADMAAELLDACDIDRAVVSGCSMGGYIAMAMLRRHPRRLAGLVLANTRASADSPEAQENRRRQAEAIRNGKLQEYLDEMLSKLLGDSTVAAAPDVVRLVEDIMQRATPEGTAGMLEAMAERPDSLHDLADARVPVCIVTGAEDTLILPAEAEAMHAELLDSELNVIPNCGHLSCLERPVRFNAVLRTFIQTRILK
ncbi:MAG: alpha/beta fold hydrolase [Bacteroidetes bacterium]|nr:alpha/beta fold hydrolase [Bacteroidota bacterium]